MEDGAWMPWENSSVVAAAAAVAVAAVAHPDLEKLLEFYYGIGPSGVRGSIRLVLRSTDARILLFFPRRKKSNIQKTIKKDQKRAKTGIAEKSPIEISLTPIPLRGLLCICKVFEASRE